MSFNIETGGAFSIAMLFLWGLRDLHPGRAGQADRFPRRRRRDGSLPAGPARPVRRSGDRA